MARLVMLLAVLVSMLSDPATAMEPEQREVIVISARAWEGHEYRETFIPSTVGELVLIAGNDSAITYARTLEYYWPLSRQVYVDFQRQRDIVEGELVIRRGGAEVGRQELQIFSIHYPEGATRGKAELLWGEGAERAHEEHREAERAFARDFAAARRAHTAYERQLVESARARQAGEAPEAIEPPPPLPEPSLSLVTPPQPGFRIALEPGDYTISLERADRLVPGTERRLRMVSPSGGDVLVADIVPAERWTRPLAANIAAARVYARPGTVFYLTLAEASRHAETDYVPVVRPQAEPVAGRMLWIRRGPASVEELGIVWHGAGNGTLHREALKVEQTRGTGFGYRVRTAREDESPDLNAFTVSVPEDAAVGRGIIGGADPQLRREIVVVHPRNTMLALFLALVPLGAFLAYKRLAARRAARVDP
ncbi:hypothetical protein GRZ55_08560 [Chelativorans sp. ZYF759]|uniref:hypothetical protein n=1 Tax=Chelativorans sp. ZYF759 TaxID=2692213 RepID=UPI00145E6A2C|nr:hypothetical protein [Chelativorans sp. ZYF759]NMG39288.1 hypothetical protein [Chelativorans sp. ZYF759]